MEQILNSYYRNDAKKLHIMVDKILKKLGIEYMVDNEDFYSLANEIFVDVIKRYDEEKSFDTFLYSCLLNKFKTEMTRRNRQKRQADRLSISLESPLGDEEDGTLEDIISSGKDVESEIFDETEDGYSKKVFSYLKRLSNLQKEVLRLIISGYDTEEIKEELHITDKQYKDCDMAIHSYRNVSLLY